MAFFSSKRELSGEFSDHHMMTPADAEAAPDAHFESIGVSLTSIIIAKRSVVLSVIDS